VRNYSLTWISHPFLGLAFILFLFQGFLFSTKRFFFLIYSLFPIKGNQSIFTIIIPWCKLIKRFYYLCLEVSPLWFFFVTNSCLWLNQQKNYVRVIFLCYSYNFVYLVGSYDPCYDPTIYAFSIPKRSLVESRVWHPWYRVRHHLVGTGRDVQPCLMVPLDVKNAMQFLIWLELIDRELAEMKRELAGDNKLILKVMI